MYFFSDESRATLMVLMVGRENMSSVAISVQQELDVNKEGESCYGPILLGMSLLALFVYKKVLN